MERAFCLRKVAFSGIVAWRGRRGKKAWKKKGGRYHKNSSSEILNSASEGYNSTGELKEGGSK